MHDASFFRRIGGRLRYRGRFMTLESAGLKLVMDRQVPQVTTSAAAVRTLLAPENYARFRQRAAEIRNNAVYEIPRFLDRILSGTIGSRPDRECDSDGRFRPDSVRSA